VPRIRGAAECARFTRLHTMTAGTAGSRVLLSGPSDAKNGQWRNETFAKKIYGLARSAVAANAGGASVLRGLLVRVSKLDERGASLHARPKNEIPTGRPRK